MSVNYYLLTEDLKVEKVVNIFYKKTKGIVFSKPYNFLVRTDSLSDFDIILDVLKNIDYYIKNNHLEKSILENEFYFLEMYLMNDDMTFKHEELDFVKELRVLFLNHNGLISCDFEKQLFFVYEEVKVEEEVYKPLTYLPIIDDRIFSYGVSNIKHFYFKDMEIGYVTSDLILGYLSEKKNKKEDIFTEKTITLNEFIFYLESFIGLKEPHKEDIDYFNVRQNNFKEQLKDLLFYQEKFGNKKIYMSSVV